MTTAINTHVCFKCLTDQVPVVRSIALNYGTGRLQVYLSETLLPPPSSNQVNLHFGNLRTPFYHQVHVNIAAVVTMPSYVNWPLSLPIPTSPPLVVSACSTTVCSSGSGDGGLQVYLKNMNKVLSDATDVTSGSALPYMPMLKSYVAAINDNANNPIELRLAGLRPGQEYQITTYREWCWSSSLLAATPLSYIVLHCPPLSYIVLHCPTLSYIVLHCPTLSYIVPHVHSTETD
jgi:hypothetical protein